MPITTATLDRFRRPLAAQSRKWLVTGVAGFIGSNLLEALLSLDQDVVGIDNFATGSARNLEDVRETVGEARWQRFRFHEGDIRELEACQRAMDGVDVVLHQAALGSIPRSLANPIATNQVNVDGFLNVIVAARDANIGRFVYAGSSSTYGDSVALPKLEDVIGKPLSPYAVTKYANELYASVFHRSFGVPVIGLRYFNVFGPRQNPNGPYAAVIPRWIETLLNGDACTIFGDGQTSRDFCYVDNVVQANLLAATTTDEEAIGLVYNIAFGAATTLAELYAAIRERLVKELPDRRDVLDLDVQYADFRAGDMRHSKADIGRAQRLLSYRPTHDVRAGLDHAMRWYVARAVTKSP